MNAPTVFIYDSALNSSTEQETAQTKLISKGKTKEPMIIHWAC
jgi:hypothetical protein